MDRRSFLGHVGHGFTLSATLLLTGCRSTQKAHVMKANENDMVGSHTAGAETWEPLIEESVGKLLGRQTILMTGGPQGSGENGRKSICFCGVENKSAEEIGDFKDQIYQKIDQCIAGSAVFDVINTRYVEAGLKRCQLRPDDLFVPANLREFSGVMEQSGHSIDCLMYATVTSGTTRNNDKAYQRDYLLTLELIDVASGRSDKESAEIRKAYKKSRFG